MVFVIRFASYFIVLFLVYSTYGKDGFKKCRPIYAGRMACPDCKAPYLVNCNGYIGFIPGNVLTPFDYEAYNVESIVEMGYATEFYIPIGTPLYKTPLGRTTVALAGKSKRKIEENYPCQYVSPSIPNRVQTRTPRGLEWTVCYGHAVCAVGLDDFELDKARTEVFPVACTATLQDECPTARECIEDTAVEFSEIASKREKEESQFMINQRLEKMVMRAIRESADEFKNESWDKIQKRIDEEIKIDTVRQRAVEAWMVSQQEEREHYRTVREKQRRELEKRKRARHGSR